MLSDQHNSEVNELYLVYVLDVIIVTKCWYLVRRDDDEQHFHDQWRKREELYKLIRTWKGGGLYLEYLVPNANWIYIFSVSSLGISR